MGEIKVTYEALFEILRRERSSEVLSELSSTFFRDISEYIKEKERIVSEKIGGDFFGDAEVEMAQKQLSNAKRIIDSIYSRRERKIIDMALNKTRVGEMPLRGLLDEERELFEGVVEVLGKNRSTLISSIVKREKIKSIKSEMTIKEKITNSDETPKVSSGTMIGGYSGESKVDDDDSSGKTDATSVKFLKDVETFIGKDLEEYGPFKAGDKAELDPDIAKVLVNRGEAIDASGE